MDKTQEALDILQEECAEVIQNVSKCRRFGLDNVYLKDQGTQRDNLAKEVGDVLAMIDILVDQGVFSLEDLDRAKQAKVEKLKVWSTIFK